MHRPQELFVILLVVTMIGACVASAYAAPDLAAAKQNYMLFCAKCHGADGKGDGPAAATLRTKPRDYANCTKMAKISDATLFKAIKDGGKSVGLSSEMPSWSAGFSDQQIHDLVAFVRSFCKH